MSSISHRVDGHGVDGEPPARAGGRRSARDGQGPRPTGARHEALTVGADPLHLALVFNLSHTTASRYAAFAQNLLDDQIEHPARNE